MSKISLRPQYREVGNIIQKHAQSEGFSVVRSYCGHGIHRLFHCAPNVPHYAKNKAVGVMKPGHAFTIEPMISQGQFKLAKATGLIVRLSFSDFFDILTIYQCQIFDILVGQFLSSCENY